MSDQATQSDDQRMLNRGKKIHLRSVDTKVTVREPSLEAILDSSSELVEVLNSPLFQGNDEKDGLEFFKLLTKSDDFRQALYKVASAVTDEPPQTFHQMGISDWLRLIATAKEVLNWEELKEVFTQLGLTEILSSLLPSAQRPEAISSQNS